MAGPLNKGKEFAIGKLVLRPHRELLDCGRPVSLGTKPLEILSILVEAGGAVVTKDELIAAAWPGMIVEENTLFVHVSALRKALDAEAGRLVAVRGRGYRMNLDGPRDLVGLTMQAPGLLPGSIAVMPFANMTEREANAYLADGMTEELIVTLSRGTELKVASRMATFAYKGLAVDPRQVGRDLGVTTVLEGSIRREGHRIRVTVQLIDAQSGFHLWSQNYDRPFGNLFALQDELAAEIAAALERRLKPVGRPTADLDAYNDYLSAVAMRHRVEQAPTAVQLLSKAIARDPAFSRAYSARAGVIFMGLGHEVVPADLRAMAREDAGTALRLDPEDLDAQVALGWLCANDRQWLEADAAFRRAMDIDPHHLEAYGFYASHLLWALGHLERASALLNRALDLAPAKAYSAVIKGACEALCGRSDEAVQWVRQAVRMGFPENREPAAFVLAWAAQAEGNWNEATRWFAVTAPTRQIEAGAVDIVRQVFRAEFTGEGRAAASDALEELGARLSDPATQWRDAHCLIDFQTRLGAIDRAYATAGKLVHASQTLFDSATLCCVWAPHMRAFREDPRFQGLVHALNMFTYWDRFGPPDGHAIRKGRLFCL